MKVGKIEIEVEYETCMLEDGSVWVRFAHMFKNEWLEWEKIE